MTTAIATTTDQRLIALRNTVAPGLSDGEFSLFCELVKSTKLNPFTKEIWAIKAGGRLQLMTGINGFLRIANSHPQYDGMEVEHEWDEKGLVACTVKVHRKDRKFPSVATAYMQEYRKKTPVWDSMPSVMLAKCAKSLAIREAFIQELGGLYTAEEMPSDYAAPREIVDVGNQTIATVDTYTGEIVAEEKDDIPAEWSRPQKAKKAQTTFYNIEILEDAKKEAAKKYLEQNLAVEIQSNIFKCPIRLAKLTSCIVEEFEESND